MTFEWTGESYPPVGCCIFCGDTSGTLTAEHIVPYGLLPKGGDWVLPAATCGACAKITSKFEGACLQNMLGPLRTHLGLKSRKRSGRKVKKPSDDMEVTFASRDGNTRTTKMPINDFPLLSVGFRWKAAGILQGKPPQNVFEGADVVRYRAGDIEKLKLGERGLKLGRVYPLDFARMLAKIAHTYTVARFGLKAFKPALLDVVLGKSDTAPYLIGGDESGVPIPEQPTIAHDIYPQLCAISGRVYVGVAIRLFAFMGMPRYYVVVGENLTVPVPATTVSGER